MPKSAPQRTQRIPEDHREIGFSLSVVYFYRSPLDPQWTLWLFSASSVLSSEKRNHKVAGTRRKVQSTKSIRVIANFVELDRSAAHARKRGLDFITT